MYLLPGGMPFSCLDPTFVGGGRGTSTTSGEGEAPPPPLAMAQPPPQALHHYKGKELSVTTWSAHQLGTKFNVIHLPYFFPLVTNLLILIGLLALQ